MVLCRRLIEKIRAGFYIVVFFYQFLFYGFSSLTIRRLCIFHIGQPFLDNIHNGNYVHNHQQRLTLCRPIHKPLSFFSYKIPTSKFTIVFFCCLIICLCRVYLVVIKTQMNFFAIYRNSNPPIIPLFIPGYAFVAT